MASIQLSLRLCKSGVSLKTVVDSFDDMKPYKADRGFVLISQKKEGVPDWLSVLRSESLSKIPDLHTMSCGAAYVMEVQYKAKKYVVAYTFGTAHHRLEDDLFEPRFGLRVALNLIESNKLRNMDVASLDASTLKTRMQASRSTSVNDFGLDVNQDLLTLLSGASSDASFARAVTGRDAISMRAMPSAGFFKDKAIQAIEIYKKRTYKSKYPWVDYIDPVKDSVVLAALERDLFDELVQIASGHPTDASLSTPDISDPLVAEAVTYAGAGMRPGKKKVFDEIDIYDYVSEIKASLLGGRLAMDEMRASHRIVMEDQATGIPRSERVFRSINFEVSRAGLRYVLFGGSWYQVDAKHAKSVEDEFNSFLIPKAIFKPTTARNERQYIEELNSRSDLLNMDQTKIDPAGTTQANIEPCDFLSTKKHLIHLKDAAASSSMSHLWSQGQVSCTLMMTDGIFREKFIKEAKKRETKYKKKGFSELLPSKSAAPDPSKFTVVFGVMRARNRKNGQLDVPFFSKVAMRPSLTAIRLMSYKVFVEIIEKV
ncbi:DUF6119 family protein [Stenotrophomonas aracearum]|uniref:DUF6119 family protein n=1 Tax=Stenotrophomonas aracearum TaxID=3003272 RepID=UPI002880694B|nr:DUF6119 family protein [Stenotrophomonas sp. A5588]